MEKIYLDTSVVSAYFDDRIPYQRELTRAWWEGIWSRYELCLSTVTRLELEAAAEPKRSSFVQLIEDVSVLEFVAEVAGIADMYLMGKIIPPKSVGDAFHLAFASHYKIDYFVTWNCSHFANVGTRRKIRMFNTAAGLFVPEIVTPEFFLEDQK